MVKTLHIRVHPTDPQTRLIKQAANVLHRGGVLICPTDASYSLVCRVGDKDAEDRIRSIREVERDHYFTIMCADVSTLATYAKISNTAYRLIRSLAPGPYTFILPATRELPRRLQDPKRKSIGLRVPVHPFVHGLLAEIGDPLLSSTLIDQDLGMPYADPDLMLEKFGHAVNALIDCGPIGIEMSTVLDLTDSSPRLVRQGKGVVEDVLDLVS